MRGVALALIAMWTALTVHHLVDKLYVNNIYIHLGVLLGLLQLIDLHTRSSVQKLDYLEEGYTRALIRLQSDAFPLAWCWVCTR